jgi:hypothetical protein
VRMISVFSMFYMKFRLMWLTSDCLAVLTDPFIATRLRPVLIIYRMMALGVLLLWGWGIDMHIWTKYRVNYVFIFEFDPRRHTRAESIFTVHFSLILILSLSSLSLSLFAFHFVFMKKNGNNEFLIFTSHHITSHHIICFHSMIRFDLFWIDIRLPLSSQ